MASFSILRFSSRLSHISAHRCPVVPVHGSQIISIRPLYQSTVFLSSKKDNQDKDSINTESNEYSKSGSDHEAAQMDDPSFNPKRTSPESQKKRSGEGTNPLEVSPANPDVSEGTDSEQPENSPKERSSTKQSGPGSPKKGKKV